MSRHAFLIMAHKVDHVLITLVRMLDNENNDIYLHFDLKSKEDPRILTKHLLHSSLFLVKRTKVYWGHISQPQAMYALWEESYRHGPYAYYHLISGADLPIKTQSEIQEFFKQNNGKNFLGFSKNNIPDKYYYRYFHPKYRCIQQLQKFSLFVQKITGSKNRLFDKYVLRRGCNWSSLTNDAVKIILAHKKEFLTALAHSNCPDECITQTILYNSNLKDSIYNIENEFESCMRLIDWNRGTPYNYTINDIDEIKNSNRIFCRKISDPALADIIHKTYGHDD